MNRKELKTIILADLYRYYGEISWKKFVKAFLIIPGFRYSFFLRKSTFYKRKGICKLCFYFYKIILRHYRFKYGFEISEDTKIGAGLYLGHFGGVVINPKAIIGKNISIAHGVTIGKVQRGRKQGVPEIGDNVWVGTNVVVVGGIKIGNEALLAPGSFVNFDVPEKAVVVGNPGQIVSYKGSKDGYLTHTL